MRRRGRLLVVVTLASVVFASFLLLTSASTSTAGPLTALLERVGSSVAALEHRIRIGLLGGGRLRTLAWFQPYRDSLSLLRHPRDVLLGVYDGGVPATLDGVERLERALGVQLPLVQAYGAWGDKPEQQFPRGLLTAIADFGSVPLVTWEPWLVDFDNGRHPGLALRDHRDEHGLAAVARGDYDFYIDAWAREAADYRRPMFLRFAHEMNDPYRYPWGPQHDTKEEYIAAWRHVVSRFRLAGATNVLWVWSPHVAYQYWETYYPGDAYVDWVATGALNFGPIAQWSRWWTFDEIFGSKYPALASFRKPIMIAELGSLAVGGDRATWYREALDSLPSRYPAVRAVLLFHTAGDKTVTYQAVDWTVVDDITTRASLGASLRRWAPGPRTPPVPGR
ncbi:MAG: cellulase [Gemmatimonadaceae bacterium]|nr:cellulase [Gemmatimonadaceae bacterium]